VGTLESLRKKPDDIDRRAGAPDLPMTIQAVCFDYGGVLARLDRQEMAHIEDRYGLPRGGLWHALFEIPEWHEVAVGRGSEQEWLTRVLDKLTELAGQPIPEIGQEWQRIWKGIDDEVVSLARKLRSRYKVGMISNATKNLEDMLEHQHGIIDLFDVIINSARVGLVKPDPRIYYLAAERLAVPISACVFTDDLVANVEAARAVGMQAFEFQGAAHLESELKALGVEWEE
jgi:putative hydrolase of the HAD superfamily